MPTLSREDEQTGANTVSEFDVEHARRTATGARDWRVLEACDEIERLRAETEGRWQDLLNTQDRMVIAEERLEAAERRAAKYRAAIIESLKMSGNIGGEPRIVANTPSSIQVLLDALEDEAE